MIIVRVTKEAYREALERLGQDTPSSEEIFERGTHSYLEHPRVIKLRMGGALEERLDELVLMLAQTRASYEIIRIWNATEGEDYADTREEYVALADEFERLQEQSSRLAAEIKALSGEVVELERRLRDLGGDPEIIEPPFPKTLNSPFSGGPTPAQKQGLLSKLWHRLSGLGER